MFCLFLFQPSDLVGQNTFECTVENLRVADFAIARSQVDAIESFSQNYSIVTVDVPVSFTVVYDDNGNGNGGEVTQAQVDAGLMNLNDKFQALTGFNFVQCGEINYLSKSTLQAPSIYIYSYVSSAINVYISAVSGSSAFYPCEFVPINCGFQDNVVFISGGVTLLSNTFPHEIGHHFGLMHTFDNVVKYEYPVEEDQQDHPVNGVINNGHPRELVIRVPEPSTSEKEFKEPNCHDAGDLVCDTPAECAPGSSRAFAYPSSSHEDYPECSGPTGGTSCDNGCTFDYNTCTYVGDYLDYNQDPITPVSISSIGMNLMSVWGSCRDHFTQGQVGRILYYYVNQRHEQYENPNCGNWSDEVDFWGTNMGIKNTTINLTHPNNERFCHATTNPDGDFGGILYEDLVASNVTKLGNESNNMYTQDEWTDGISTFDLTQINKQILNIQDLPNGYAKIAADVNNSGMVTTLDLVHIQKLILLVNESFIAFDQPWRFVPEYIVTDYADQFHADPFNMTIDGFTYTNEAPYLNSDWEYDMPSEGSNNRGFDAIKIGDADGSAEPDNSPEDTGDPVFLTIDKTIIGDKAKYDFKVEGFQDIVGYQMVINFDKNNLDYSHSLEKDLSGVIEDYFAAVDANGTIRTLWYDATNGEAKSLPDLNKIFQLIFDGEGEFSAANVQLATESSSGARLRANANYQMKNFAIDKDGVLHPIIQREVFDNGIISIDVVPNPFENDLNLNIDMVRSDYVNIEIYNALGQYVYSEKVFFIQGTNKFNLSEVAELPKGLFIVTATNSGKTFTKKVVGL